ncbi:MAG: CRTAC1 family protein [Acidobacteria bacterium]|nr:CRTAC1 family protein [Acidobacteriota bacterium]
MRKCFKNKKIGAFASILLSACQAAPEASDPESATSLVAYPFSEEAVRLGLDFLHFNGMSGEYYFPEITGPGAALLDFDGDGDLDAFLLQGRMLDPRRPLRDATFPPPGESAPTHRLFRNELHRPDGTAGPLRFVDVTAASGVDFVDAGMGVATGDYDGDGRVDLYLANFGSNRLLRNRGDGTFEDVTAKSGADDPRWSVAAAFFDYDGDGWLDLYVANYVDFTVATHKLCRAETGAPDYCGPLSYRPQPDRLLRNRGDGTFEDVTLSSGIHAAFGAALGVVPADFDLDGRMDLYVANDGSANQLWMNRGGRFTDEALLAGCAVNAAGQPEASMGVDAADFDRDGDEDLFMTHLSGETNTLYVNDGTGNFLDATREASPGQASWSVTGFGTAWLDLDNDGWLDLLVANGAVKVIEAQRQAGDPFPLRQRNQLFRRIPAAGWEELTEAAGPAFEPLEVSRAAAFGDLDDDGDTDVLLLNNSGPARLLINQVGQANPWIGLRLVTGKPARDALGAWVGIHRKAAPTLWRRLRTAGSYAAANDPRILLGLGDGPEVTGVEVQWPGGRKERFAPVQIGRYQTLAAGTGEPLSP